MQELPMTSLTPTLHDEYTTLFETCRIRPDHFDTVARLSARIQEYRPRYAPIEERLGLPWYVVGLIHAMETSPPLALSGHLHNGDPLTARTVHVPKGRPISGTPPFTWEESAIDALELGGFSRWTDWTIPGLLYRMERYNGWGYRRHHPDVLSPYLWSFTNHYSAGKYVADGRFSPTAVSAQCGAAALLRQLIDDGHVTPDGTPTPLIQYKKGKAPHVKALQCFINHLPGPTVAVDGIPGPQSSAALCRITGHYLVGDPRAEALDPGQSSRRR